MNRHVSSKKLSRRGFLSSVATSGFSLVAALSVSCRTTSETDLKTPALDAKPAPASSLVDFGPDGPEIPRLLLFPDCRKTKAAPPSDCSVMPIRITRMSFGDPADPKVMITFSNNRESTLHGAAVSRRAREAVVLKSVAAWTLYGTFKEARGRIDPMFFEVVRRNFEDLQRMEVLDAVSIRAVAALQKEIRARKNIRGVRWESRNDAFIVDS